MKQLLVNAVLSFVIGVFFCLGFVLIEMLFAVDKRSSDLVHVDQPDGFIFSDHSIIHGQPNLTVSGKISNTSDIVWSSVQVFAKIYAGEAYMTYCRQGIDFVDANATRNFRLVCSQTAGTNLPENISYELYIDRGARK